MTWKILTIDVRIILKYILKERGIGVPNKFKWLKTGTNCWVVGKL
jgi:hypothetical protein